MSDRCGTYGGYQQHRKDDEPACDACREACRDYMRHYRSREEVRARQSVQLSARRRALEQLRRRHAEEFRALYEAELDILDPRGTVQEAEQCSA